MSFKLVHVVTVPMTLHFLRGQCSYMVECGASVTVISAPGVALGDFARTEGVDAHAIPMARAITPLADLVAVCRLWMQLQRDHPDVVHAHTPKAGLLAMLAATLARVPVRVYQVHGLAFETACGRRRALLKATEWVACHLAHSVLVVSNSCRDVAEASGVCPPGKGLVLAHGSVNGVDAHVKFVPREDDQLVDLRRGLRLRNDQRVLGFVGRLVRDKGIEELTQAWNLLKELHEDLQLVVVGPVEAADAVSRRTLRELEGDDRVRMVGHVDDPALYYSLFSVLALPSRREGFGLAALEAAACGVPVVASRIAGLVDAVEDGVTGTLVALQSPIELAKAVDHYLSEPDIAVRHGQSGRARAIAMFDQPTMWRLTKEFYDSLLRDSRGVGHQTGMRRTSQVDS